MVLNANSIVQLATRNKNGIIKHVSVNVKTMVSAKKL